MAVRIRAAPLIRFYTEILFSDGYTYVWCVHYTMNSFENVLYRRKNKRTLKGEINLMANIGAFAFRENIFFIVWNFFIIFSIITVKGTKGWIVPLQWKWMWTAADWHVTLMNAAALAGVCITVGYCFAIYLLHSVNVYSGAGFCGSSKDGYMHESISHAYRFLMHSFFHSNWICSFGSILTHSIRRKKRQCQTELIAICHWMIADNEHSLFPNNVYMCCSFHDVCKSDSIYFTFENICTGNSSASSEFKSLPLLSATNNLQLFKTF